MAIAGLLLLALGTLAAYTNVPTAVTASDAAVFAAMELQKPQQSLTFEQEVALIRRVQKEVFQRAPLGDGIPDYEQRTCRPDALWPGPVL